MTVGLLMQAVERGTIGRLTSVYWKDMKKARIVKKFLKGLMEEYTISIDLRNGVIAELGEGNRVPPESPNYDEATKRINELGEQELTVKPEVQLTDGDFVAVEGISTYDIEVLEQLGLLAEEA